MPIAARMTSKRLVSSCLDIDLRQRKRGNATAFRGERLEELSVWLGVDKLRLQARLRANVDVSVDVLNETEITSQIMISIATIQVSYFNIEYLFGQCCPSE